MSGSIIDRVNDKRASEGKNSIHYGSLAGTGKDTGLRPNSNPWFSGMKPIGRSKLGLVEFRIGISTTRSTTEEEIKKWEVRSGEKIL